MTLTRCCVAASLALTCTGAAMAQQAMFGGRNTMQVVAGWDGTYDACEARVPGLTGYRDIMLMMSFGAAVKLGSDEYHRAAAHLRSLRANAGYAPEYEASRAQAGSAPADRMNALCRRIAQGVQEMLSKQ